VFTPSLSIAGVYDDNLFGTATDQESVGLSRISPRLQHAGRPQPRVVISASYGFSSEVYPDLSEENQVFANQLGELSVVSNLSTNTTFSLGGSYARTHTPRNLLLETGLEFGRELAQNFAGGAKLQHQLGPSDVLSEDYRYTRLEFETEPSTDSHSWALGWTHRLGRRGSLSLRGGAQRIEGEFNPLYGAAVSRDFRNTSIGASYSRDSYAIPTEGRVDTDSFGVDIEQRLGRSARLTLSPGISRNVGPDLDITVYRMNVRISVPLGRWVSVNAAYDGNFQRTRLTGPGDTSGGDLDHNVASLDFTFARPYRRR
jgi:hypothetical protein